VKHPPARSLPLELAALRSEFRSAATERAFLAHHLATTQAQLRVTFLFCAVFYMAFAITDVVWMGMTQTAALLVGARLLVVICALASLWLLRRYPRSIVIPRRVASATEVLGAAGFLLIVALRPGEFSLHAISMSIVLIVIYIYIPNRLLYATAIALPATAIFATLAAALGHLRLIELGTMTTLLLLTNLFGFVAARRYQLLLRDEYCSQSVLKNLSVRDPLTGCYNRRHLHEQLLETEIFRAQRYKLSLTVIMCDLDHFKNVNDTYGHDGGDAVLQMFAGLLQSMTRDNIDSVVRYGGEEFLLILPETDLAGGVLLAERLRQTFAATPIHSGAHEIHATASFGVASIDFASATTSAPHKGMITAADDLLYAAKKGGRNQVRSQQLSQ